MVNIRYANEEKVTRQTLPTASFTLPQSQIDWIEHERERRQLRGKSQIVRELIDRAMADEAATEQEAA